MKRKDVRPSARFVVNERTAAGLANRPLCIIGTRIYGSGGEIKCDRSYVVA